MTRKHKIKIKKLPSRNPTVASMRTRSGQGKHLEKKKQKELGDKKFYG